MSRTFGSSVWGSDGTRKLWYGFVHMNHKRTSRQSEEFAAKFARIFLLARLGRALRYQYDAIARQPVPGELQQLMDRLRSVDQDGKPVRK